MHEASLMAGLTRRIAEVASVEQAKKIRVVHVWLGALSHFSAEHFREHFEDATRNTPAEGAELVVTLSDDITDPRAQDVLLQRVEIED
jgi:hydrogenase nickel incorporation protein HypA/HybF